MAHNPGTLWMKTFTYTTSRLSLNLSTKCHKTNHWESSWLDARTQLIWYWTLCKRPPCRVPQTRARNPHYVKLPQVIGHVRWPHLAISKLIFLILTTKQSGWQLHIMQCFAPHYPTWAELDAAGHVQGGAWTRLWSSRKTTRNTA